MVHNIRTGATAATASFELPGDEHFNSCLALCSLFSLVAPRAFHKSFAIKCIHTLFKNCRGVTPNSNSPFETRNGLPWPRQQETANNSESLLVFSLLHYFLPSCATLKDYTNTQFHDY
jgi:hypothetical protein